MMISIILPYYEPYKKYFGECLNSIINQDSDLFELIIVIHKSEMNSFDFKIPDFIKFKTCIANKLDQSSKRNVGIKNALGDYICFIDSDDIVSKNYISTAHNDLYLYKPDILTYAITSDNLLFRSYKKQNIFLKYEEVRKAIYGEFFGCQERINHIFNSSCGKFFKREIILQNNVFFLEGFKCGEDSIFVRQFGLHCKNVLVNLEFYPYYWRINNDSTSHTLFTGYFDVNPYFIEIKKILEKMTCNYFPVFYNYIVKICVIRFDLIVNFLLEKKITRTDAIKSYVLYYKDSNIIKNAFLYSKEQGRSFKVLRFAIIHNCFLLLYILLTIKVLQNKPNLIKKEHANEKR